MYNYSHSLLLLFTRDLNKLKEELSLYSSENIIWKTEGHVSNSAGNLTLHLIGNLNHFIGATLGNTGYVRYREAEFTKKDIARETLINDIDSVIIILTDVLGSLTNADMEAEFPLAIGNKKDSTAGILVHLYGHLAYHLGQINYHRRLLDK